MELTSWQECLNRNHYSQQAASIGIVLEEWMYGLDLKDQDVYGKRFQMQATRRKVLVE